MNAKKLFVLIVLMVIPSVVLAGIDGKISGTVTDAETNNSLTGTNVIVVGTSLGASTDADGKYTILNVPVGVYSVRATFIGYATFTVENVKITTDLTTLLDFALSTVAVAGEAITVVAVEPLVNLTATNVVRTVDAELLKKLATRSMTNFLGLHAGVVVHNRTIVIRGGRADETGFQVEGISTAPAVGSSGQGLSTIPEAIEEIRVLVGGFSADIGGGAAGIVQQTFRTGRTSIHGSIQAETDGLADGFGDTFEYGYNDLTATLSGPLGPLKYFVAYENFTKDDNNVQFFTGSPVDDDGKDLFGYMVDTGADGGTKGDSALVVWDSGKIPGRSHEHSIVNGTIQADLNPLILRFSGAFSTHERRLNSLPIRNMFNLGRLPQRDDKNSLYNLRASYLFSDNTVFNASVAIFKNDFQQYDPNFITDGVFDMARQLDSGDSLTVAEAGDRIGEKWVYPSRYVDPRPYNFDGFRFTRPGDILTGYFKREQSYLDLSGGLVTQYGSHEIRAGASYRKWTIREYSFGSTLTRSLNSQFGGDPGLRAEVESGTERARLLIRRGAGGGYGYDEFGDEVNEGPYDAKSPKFTSAYINDKIEFNDIIVNFGVRVDNFDLDTWHLADSANPGYNKSEATIDLTEDDKAESTTEIQPRFGLAFPISDRMVFHLQYGKFATHPDLINAFTSLNVMAFSLGGGVFNPNPVGWDLDPVVSTSYEIGFNYQFASEASFDITSFYKSTEGQLTIDLNKITPGIAGGDYNVFINGDFAVTRGFEFTLRTRRVARTQTLVNYTLSVAKGTNSFPNSRVSSTEREIKPPKYITPLRSEQRHRASLIFDYRFAGEDKGPLGGLFANSGVNTLINVNSGHTYTRSTGPLAQRRADDGALLNDRDPRARTPTEPIGASTTPWVFTVDLKLDKNISLGNYNAGVYVRVSNLFNRQNVVNVYNRTGDAFDDGFLADPELSEKVVGGLGPQFVPLYRAINLENRQHWITDRGLARDLFGTPRQVVVGVNLDF